jgi:hypothetical protein
MSNAKRMANMMFSPYGESYVRIATAARAVAVGDANGTRSSRAVVRFEDVPLRDCMWTVSAVEPEIMMCIASNK